MAFVWNEDSKKKAIPILIVFRSKGGDTKIVFSIPNFTSVNSLLVYLKHRKIIPDRSYSAWIEDDEKDKIFLDREYILSDNANCSALNQELKDIWMTTIFVGLKEENRATKKRPREASPEI